MRLASYVCDRGLGSDGHGDIAVVPGAVAVAVVGSNSGVSEHESLVLAGGEMFDR